MLSYLYEHDVRTSECQDQTTRFLTTRLAGQVYHAGSGAGRQVPIHQRESVSRAIAGMTLRQETDAVLPGIRSRPSQNGDLVHRQHHRAQYGRGWWIRAGTAPMYWRSALTRGKPGLPLVGRALRQWRYQRRKIGWPGRCVCVFLVGWGNRRMPGEEQLRFAMVNQRVLVTYNRADSQALDAQCHLGSRVHASIDWCAGKSNPRQDFGSLIRALAVLAHERETLAGLCQPLPRPQGH